MLDDVISRWEHPEEKPSLLLHCCCAPCASYVLEYLSEYFRISTLFCDINIKPKIEFDKRADELRRLLAMKEYKFVEQSIFSDWDENRFDQIVVDVPFDNEGGNRCTTCFAFRLNETASKAVGGHFSFFATTLTVSPHKNAKKINLLGENLSKSQGINYLISDFKKRNGYQRTVELSKKYELYRQAYCGCMPTNENGVAK